MCIFCEIVKILKAANISETHLAEVEKRLMTVAENVGELIEIHRSVFNRNNNVYSEEEKIKLDGIIDTFFVNEPVPSSLEEILKTVFGDGLTVFKVDEGESIAEALARLNKAEGSSKMH